MKVLDNSLVKVIAAAVILFLVVAALGWLTSSLADWLGIRGDSTSLIFMFVLIGLLCIPWFLTWRGRNRRSALLRNNKCVGCEYDLTGNISGFCPECGCQVPGVIFLICEECGTEVALPLQTQGTRQDCPICKKPGDVPDFGQVDSG